MENNYYNYEQPYYDRPGFVEPNSADKYRNITNVSQISNYYIKQISPNEFIFKCNNFIWILLFVILITSSFLSIFICILIFDESKNKSIGGLIFGCCFVGFIC